MKIQMSFLSRRVFGRIHAVTIIAVLLVSAAGAVYWYSAIKTLPTATPSRLVVEEESQPDSMDPAVSYTTFGWEIIDQVYQGLIAPNGTSYTTYVGVLARNWTISTDGMTYTFSLRPRVTFSNGNPFNAYVMWFSLYRTLVMNQAPAWILRQNLAPGNNANFKITDRILNSINYNNPSPEDLAYMTYPNQSVQVGKSDQLIMHLGYGYNGYAPYSAFLATLTTSTAMTVDPNVVKANGGVHADEPNNWMESHAVGTSFYELQSWIQGQSVTLVRSLKYWGMDVPISERNYAIQPAIIDSINFYYKPASTRIADLRSGFAQIIAAPISQYDVLRQIQGVTVSILPTIFGSAQNVFFVYMDPYAFAPFQDPRIREAIANAIDYKSIIHTVLNDLATQWIGPVPPGFPYYDESTAGLKPYEYNPTKAARLLAEAGYTSNLPNGTKLNRTGKMFPSVNFLYDTDSPTEGQVAEIISTELHSIGIDIVLTPLTFRQYANVITTTSNPNSTPYPFGISFYSEDYTASIDYVSAATTTGQIGFSAYSNQTVIDWTTAAATALDEGTIIENLRKITGAMYHDYTSIWLYVPYLMAVNRSNVVGIIPNPAGCGAGYFMFYNTVHFSS